MERHDQTPAERLRARAEATDRAARFTARLDHVHRIRTRRRQVRRLMRIGWAVLFAGLGALTPLVAAAVRAAPDPSGWELAVGAVIGGLLGAVGPPLRSWIASRRGARAWDAYHERYVLLGDPSAQVRDLDQPRAEGSDSSLPPFLR